MANFTLNWTPNINSNVSIQQAEYRQKSVGGVYNTSGFSPANPLLTTDSTTSISGLLDNVVYEFRVVNFCTEGRTHSSNIEFIKFACVTPVISNTSTTVTASISSLPVDITKIKYSLLSSDGLTVLQGPIAVNTSSGSSVYVFTGLSPDTDYIVKIELVALVNGIEVTSSLGNCLTNITTDPV